MKHNTMKSVFTIALMMFAGISFLSSSAFAQSPPWVTTTASPYTNPYATPSYPASSYTSDYIYYYNSLHSPAVNPNLIQDLYIESPHPLLTSDWRDPEQLSVCTITSMGHDDCQPIYQPLRNPVIPSKPLQLQSKPHTITTRNSHQ